MSHPTLHTLRFTLHSPHFTFDTSQPPSPHATVYDSRDTGDQHTRLWQWFVLRNYSTWLHSGSWAASDFFFIVPSGCNQYKVLAHQIMETNLGSWLMSVLNTKLLRHYSKQRQSKHRHSSNSSQKSFLSQYKKWNHFCLQMSKHYQLPYSFILFFLLFFLGCALNFFPYFSISCPFYLS